MRAQAENVLQHAPVFGIDTKFEGGGGKDRIISIPLKSTAHYFYCILLLKHIFFATDSGTTMYAVYE